MQNQESSSLKKPQQRNHAPRRNHTRVLRKDESGNPSQNGVRRLSEKKALSATSVTPAQKKASSSHKKRNTHSGQRRNNGPKRVPQRIKNNTKSTQKNTHLFKDVPPLADGDIRIVPVCGVEWIGTNMTFIEYKGSIVVIDAGIGFSTPSTPGIDYTIPNTDYLESRKDDIKALIITHGHLDHVGAIPYVIDRLGYPPIYTREFGAMFIQKKLEEFPDHKDRVIIKTIPENTDYMPLSDDLSVKFFGLSHSIPDSTGVIIKTPLGGIVSTGDVRVENDNGEVAPEEIAQYAFFKNEDILLMTMDSTGIEKSGWNLSEAKVSQKVDEIIKNTTDGRLFIAAFSSQVERLITFIESAKKYGKYIALDGRSMKSNLGIAEALELTDFSHVVPIENVHEYPDNKLVIIVTGSQGEEFAALNRIAKNDHKFIKIKRTDTVLLSSSVVPGNEYEVAQLKNKLYSGSFNVITYRDDQVHASGHGAREELRWIHKQIPYKFFMPVHGEPYMLQMHTKMAQIELGVPRENIAIPQNGSIIEIRENGTKLVQLEEKIHAEPHIVEGRGISEKQDVVFRDRRALAEDGIFIIVVAMDPKTGKLKKSPDIISRGFVYLRENQRLLQDVRKMVKTTAEQKASKMKTLDFEKIKDAITHSVSKYLLQQTHKEPIVIPVVLGL
jgi:ribonuclease J